MLNTGHGAATCGNAKSPASNKPKEMPVSCLCALRVSNTGGTACITTETRHVDRLGQLGMSHTCSASSGSGACSRRSTSAAMEASSSPLASSDRRRALARPGIWVSHLAKNHCAVELLPASMSSRNFRSGPAPRSRWNQATAELVCKHPSYMCSLALPYGELRETLERRSVESTSRHGQL